MRKVFAAVGAILLLLILILVGGAGYISWNGIPIYPVEAPDMIIYPDSVRLARGEKLVAMACAKCHKGKDGKLSGGIMLEEGETEFGFAYAPNITNDAEHGLGRYSDGELIYLLRTGIKKDGKFTPPYMPKFPHMSDEDLYSIVVYLRSDAPTVASVDKPSRPSRPSFLAKALSYFAFKPLPFPEQEIISPPITDEVDHGRYLATGVIECFGCHSGDFTKMNVLEPEKSYGFMGGGNEFSDEAGDLVYSANLTMHDELGIGNWTKAEFIEAVRFGKNPRGGALSNVMPKYSAMSDQEIGTIWAWLQTLPIQENEVLRAGEGL